MLKVLKRGGRYVSSGAISGPVVDLDLHDMHLKDITPVGCTAWDAPVFRDWPPDPRHRERERSEARLPFDRHLRPG